jgi:hypothetical protein
MKALGWNCQGMVKNLGSEKMTHLARMIYSTKPQVVFVSEIKSFKVKSSDLVLGLIWLMLLLFPPVVTRVGYG